MGAADRIAETILKMGQIRAEGLQHAADAQARAQANSAQIWGGALQSLGQIPGEVAKYKLADTENKVRQAQLAREQQQQNDQFNANQIFQFTTRPDPDGTVKLDDTKFNAMMQKAQGANIDFETQSRMSNAFKQMNADGDAFRQQQLAHQVKVAQNVMSMVKPGEQLEPGVALATLKLGQANGWATAQDTEQFLNAINQGHDPADIFKAIIQNGAQPAKPITNTVEAGIAGGLTPREVFDREKPPPKVEAEPTITVKTIDAQGNPIERVMTRSEAVKQGSFPSPAPASSEGLITVKTMVNGKPVERVLTKEQALKEGVFPSQPPASVTYPKPEPTQASQEIADVKESVKGMVDGTVPPQLPGRNTKEYTAVTAEAHRQGYDLVKAIQDWTATQKYLSTLNGPQQLKLRQSITALPDLLDSVDTLADKWKAGRFPALNAANLALAKNGAYGNEAATIANSLSTQISDVRADLASIYMGGNSPTDDAFKLAETSLNQNWDNKVLHDMTNLARKNVQIRNNSIKTTGPAGTSEGNPYAPKPPAQTAPPAAAPSSLDALKAKRKALGLE